MTDVLQQTISGTCSSDVGSIDVVSPAGATLAYNHCSINGTWSLNQFTLDPLPSNGQNIFTVTAHGSWGNTASVTIIISIQVGSPTFDPPSGPTYYNELDVNMSSPTPGSVIHYKTDMTAPDCNTPSPLPLHITKSTTVWAIACKTGWGHSSGAIGVGYTLKVAYPTVSPVAGTYASAQNVVISTITNSSSIYYTTDGVTDPTCSGTGTLYTGAISIGTTTPIRAIGCRTDWPPSAVVYANYTITGTLAALLPFDPLPGTYDHSIDPLHITSIDAGATIYYTIDGADPTCDGTVGSLYSPLVGVAILGPNTIHTLKARACKPNWVPSPVSTGTYSITGVLNPPQFNPASGTMSTTPINVSISSEAGSTIYYTTDGTTPMCDTIAQQYTGSVTLNGVGNHTIIAIACETFWGKSAQATATYTIKGTVADPTFQPYLASGFIYTSAQGVTIKTGTVGATIYYTKDGTTLPVCGGGANIYTYISGSPIQLPTTPGTYTYKAIACLTNWTTSQVVTSTYIYHCSSLELSNLVVSNGLLEPVFDSGTLLYDLNLPISSGSIVSVTPTVASGCAVEAQITVNGTDIVNSGNPSSPIAMQSFNTEIPITVQVSSTWSGYTGTSPTYTLNATRGITVQDTYIKSTASATLSHFGKATAMSGDTLVIGMDVDNYNTGAVSIYTRDNSSGTWVLSQVLSGNSSGDYFGSSVAIKGDTIVVGARGATGYASGSGAVYLYTRNASGTWTNQTLRTGSNGAIGDNFGCSVAISSTLSTIAVGACNKRSQSPNVTNAGSVYVFTGSGNSWTQQTILQASIPRTGDEFGHSVSIGAGERIVVGVPFEDNKAQGVFTTFPSPLWITDGDFGAVYVFEKSGSLWNTSAYIKAGNAAAGNQFGFSVKAAGNYIIVGAPLEQSNCIGIGCINSGGNNNQTTNPVIGSGAVYVYKYDSSWTQQAGDGYVKASNPSVNAYFGSSLDASVSTISMLVVGAPGESSALVSNFTGIGYDDYLKYNALATSSGAAYVFIKDESVPGSRRQLTYLKASNTDAGDEFGTAVTCNGDVVAVGAPNEQSNAIGINCSGQAPNCQDNNSVNGAGAVYTFY